MPSKVSEQHVKFGPCECDPEMEDYSLRRSDEECPEDVVAQYQCEVCRTKVELYVDPKADHDGRGTPLTGREGWTEE